MKIIFADIDGPLVTLDDPKDTRYGRMNMFDERCVAALNDIWRHTQCEIVVSSDWSRNNFDGRLQIARNVFQHNNVQAPVIGFTRKRPSHALNLEEVRIKEILEWVETHRPEAWVAIDDMSLSDLGAEHFVLTDPIEGLANFQVKEEVIRLLNA